MRTALLLVAVLASGLSFAKSKSMNFPPITSIGETAADEPWAGVARLLIARSGQGKTISVKDLHELLPELSSQLQADSQRHEWKNLWGTSINYDEIVHDVIVHPELLKVLAQELGDERLAARGKTDEGHGLVHAGLEHTYGYLMSILQTPYGFKRARWVKPDIEKGFQLPSGVLGPRSSEGTLFSNTTYFLGQIAFREDMGALTVLRQGLQGVPRALVQYDYASLKPRRLEEEVKVGLRVIRLRTDVVPFLADSGSKQTHLLIYSYTDGDRAFLISAFPIEKGFAEQIFSGVMGEGQAIVTRYNAFVPGVTGASLTGRRREF